MMRRRVPTWIPVAPVFIALIATSVLPRCARADRPTAEAEARNLTVQAKTAFDAGHFTEAAALLVRAYAISPSSTLLYNMGRAYQQAGDRSNAIDAYQRYLATESAPPDEGAIRHTIQQLQDEIAKEGALAERAEREERERRQAQAARIEAEERARHAPNALPWIVAGTGVGGLVAGGVFGALAAGAHRDAASDPDVDSALSKQSSAKSLATISNVAFIAGGTVALSGLLWGILDLRAAARSDKPSVMFGPGSIVIGGPF
jgi:tetratricopeptide (TPR) repeat protein